MMITIAIIGLAMSVMFGGVGRALLPQARLASSAASVGRLMETMRTHALFTQQKIVFEYDLDEGGFQAYLPVVTDEDGVVLGPGRTVIHEFTPLERDIRFETVRLPGVDPINDGKAQVVISPLGRVPPHDVVLYNPEYADHEVKTVRVHGLAITFEILEGRQPPETIEDVDFD